MLKKNFPKLFAVVLVLALALTTALPVMGAPDRVRVFVEFAPGQKGAVQAALNGAGADIRHTFDDLNSFAVSIPAGKLNGIANNPNVVEVEEDPERYLVGTPDYDGIQAASLDTAGPNGQTIPWGIDSVQARDVWDINRDGSVDAGVPAGSGKTVCIIDTGFYSAHEDLSGANLLGGISLVDNDYSRDGNGHGSHVAGTVAGVNNGIGVVGVAPNVSLYIIKYFNDDGLATTASDLMAAANDCASGGADVISMSLSGTRANKREERTFNNLLADGVLSIGAASNDGGTEYHYPASYDSVVSVAALDEALAIADFSQQNDAVEIAAPGVGVLSTVPYIDDSTLVIGGNSVSGNAVEFAANGVASGTVVDGGLCTSTGSWSGAVVLCSRGDISFFDKVMNVQNSGGVAAVIYNNVANEALNATLGEGSSSAIPAIGLTMEDGQAMVAFAGSNGTVTNEHYWPVNGYAHFNGTSMATPHVSAVAALIWSQVPNATPQQVRDALTSTAVDLGAAGRDNAFGYGLVQAAAALQVLGGGGTGNAAPSVSIDSPSNGSSYDSGTQVSFAGSANDAEDGNLGSSISWTSSIDGSLGSGASVSAILSDGTHTITASVTDSGSLTATDSITVTINGGGGTGGALVVSVVTDQSSYGSRDTVVITATVTDGSAPVAGASVEVLITTPSGKVYSGTGTSDGNGEVGFNFSNNAKKNGSGTYTVDATATAAGYTGGSGSTTFIAQ